MPDTDETEVTDSPDETALSDNGDQEPTADDNQGDTNVYKRADVEKLRNEARGTASWSKTPRSGWDELCACLSQPG